jgi:cysteine desulfurase
MKSEIKRLSALRDKLIEGLFDKLDHIRLNGHPRKRLPNNVNLNLEFIEGETLLLNLDMAGIAASSGSACTSGSLEPSHVLLAIGLAPDVAHNSLRLTLGRYSRKEDVDKLLTILPRIVKKLRAVAID